MTRVSPYLLRSSRTNKQRAPESLIHSEGAREWEDIRCTICQEPPHNAVILHCASFSNGCRTYMCNTSARHSHCFKQFRRHNKTRLNKTLSCPHCRGEVFETMKVTHARRFMNAKSRSCSIEECEFSGNNSQLKNHVKIDHPGSIPPRVDPLKKRRWEQMQRDAEYNEIMTAVGIPHLTVEVVHQHPHLPVTHMRTDGIVQNDYDPNQVMTRFHGWTPTP